VPFARLYGIHTLETTPDGLNILTTIRVEGPLAWMLQKLVAEKVAKEVPQQTAMLIELARQVPVS
jgi:2-polyprenyl-3-methyl-5-hydroxy-6-metoxy-1,4-benzoquinol methylase